MEPVLCYRIDAPLADAETSVRAALQKEGFGSLTEVDVTGVLRAKLGVETRPYKILGACNPSIAHRAMGADPRVGAFLPCGLAIYEEEDGHTTVCLQNPSLISETFHTQGLEEAANEAQERLVAALRSVATPA